MTTIETSDATLQRLRAEMSEHRDALRERGYSIVRRVFSPEECATLRTACARMHAEGMRHPATFRHRNLIFWLEHDRRLARKVLRGMQWPAWIDETLDAVRTDARIFAILEPLLGPDLKQIINQIHWKTPGSGVTWHMHQDVRSRKPDSAFRNLARSWMQTCLALEPHSPRNGCLRVVPYSHRLPDLHRGPDRSKLQITDATRRIAAEVGCDLERYVDVEMRPGDIALWGAYTIHGSLPNRDPTSQRLLYINGYARAADCDRGQWSFRDGRPVPLHEPALIQYDFVNGRADPHYPAGVEPVQD